MTTTHMITTSAFESTVSVPADSKLYVATVAVARLNKFGCVTFEYHSSREDADRAAAKDADWFTAIDLVPVIRRLRNEAEIALINADARRGDEEASAFIALWPSVLRTVGKQAGQEN